MSRGLLLVILAIVMSMPCGAATGSDLERLQLPALREGHFVVAHERGDETLATETLSNLKEAAEELADRLPMGSATITVVVCGTTDHFRTLAGGYARDNVGGIAKSQQGLIVLKAPYMQTAGAHDYYGTLRHELIHVLLARNTNLEYLPRWLNEGIAMAFSGEYRWESKYRVGRMCLQGRIIDYEDLEVAFSEPSKEMRFGDAYAQALSMTRFLEKKMGGPEFWRFVRKLKETPFEEALAGTASMRVVRLYDAWKKSLWKVAVVAASISGFTVFQAAAILTLVAFVRRRRRGKRILERWEREEAEEPELLVWEEYPPSYPSDED